MLRPLKKWTKASTESISQGYEMMVTPLQLARAFCAYANGGRLVKPTLVKGFLDSEGAVVPKIPPAPFQMLPEVIDPIKAAEMKRIMCDVVVRGTAPRARSMTWNIFGKTGTAYIAEHGHYSKTKYNSSFLCGAPAENPRLVVAMIIHEPHSTVHYGGDVSGPPAKRLLEPRTFVPAGSVVPRSSAPAAADRVGTRAIQREAVRPQDAGRCSSTASAREE